MALPLVSVVLPRFFALQAMTRQESEQKRASALCPVSCVPQRSQSRAIDDHLP